MDTRALAPLTAVVALVLGSAACSTSSTTNASPSVSSSAAGGGTTLKPPDTRGVATTTRPLRYTATINKETEVNGGYRQGLARAEDLSGWVFSTNDGLHRTSYDFVDSTAPDAKANPAIPAELKQQGYNHIGDIDIAEGILWAPIEKEDKTAGEQVTAIYDATTLQFRQSFVVKQHHNSFVTVGPDNVVYSTDEFSDDTLVRYKHNGTTLEKIEPLKMSKKVDNIQGGDVAAGAIWLSTDDDQDGMYRVDLATGQVQDLGSMGRADGEGEGIDAKFQGDTSVVELEVLSIDAKLLPVRVIDVTAMPSSG